ncbi:Glycosyltransferase [Melia azedarach]|uniref:Glycosyltransferase n=1 Tax=Melia azedarach TaxID=155640 RepID=A0ACC1YC15_MELAZ|nr:Glycosyltransferase [Melia azedarach]
MDNRQRNFSVLMLPWLAHGHVTPFLELAKKLAKRNFCIYICSTPAILSSIKLSATFSLSIQLVELHLLSLPELPPHYHTTKGLPLRLMPTLKKAFDMSSPSFFRILKNLKPDLVIYDFLQPWAPAIALSQNIPAVHFLVTSATMTAFIRHTTEKPDEEFPSPAIFIHDYMKLKLSHLRQSRSNGLKDQDRVAQCFQRSCDIILIKTFRELEAQHIDYLSDLLKKKMVPVGPLVQDPVEEDGEGIEIIKWLDQKNKSSTVFVSFGSECFLSKEEMEDIALGLELSQLNFIWVVRFPSGQKINLEDELPKNFFDRTRERAMVIEGWAPQTKILEHPSIGGFVSHCGWSSVMESMKFGIPIIATPMHLDQPLNARLIEDVGVGIEVRRNKNGRIERKELAEVIKEVVMEDNGEKVRKKAREMSEKIREKGDEEMDEVVNELTRICMEY